MVSHLVVFLTTILASAFAFGQEQTFGPKRLPELLQYTGARCAYLVKVTNRAPEMEYVYTTSVIAKQISRWGDRTQWKKSLTNFQVVSINNLRNDLVPQDEGDDYYFNALSPDELNIHTKYIMICRGAGVFEAVDASPANIYKVKTMMRPNWEKNYNKTTAIEQMRKDLRDPDLHPYAYALLEKRKRVNSSIVIAALKENPDADALIDYHLRQLADKEVREILLEDTKVELVSAKQLNFVHYLVNEVGLQKDEILHTIVSNLINDDSFLKQLTKHKVEIISLYLKITGKKYKNKLEIRNRVLEKLAKHLENNRRYAFQMQEFFFLYAASVIDMEETLTDFLDSLRNRERRAFLKRLITLYDALAVVRKKSKAHETIFSILDLYLPMNPSILYMRDLQKFDPYHMTPGIADERQFRQTYGNKPVAIVRAQAKPVLVAVEFVLRSLSTIMQKYPNQKEAAKQIADKLIGADAPFEKFVNPKVLAEYHFQLTKDEKGKGVASEAPVENTNSQQAANSVSH